MNREVKSNSIWTTRCYLSYGNLWIGVLLAVTLAGTGCERSGPKKSVKQLQMEEALVGVWVNRSLRDGGFVYRFGPNNRVLIEVIQGDSLWKVEDGSGKVKYRIDASGEPAILEFISDGKTQSLQRILELVGDRMVLQGASGPANELSSEPWTRVSTDPTEQE